MTPEHHPSPEPTLIHYTNHGPLIIETDYWRSDLARHGIVGISINAGCIRICLPREMRGLVQDMRRAKVVAISRGPWRADTGQTGEAVEVMWDDGSSDPVCLHTGVEQWPMLPRAGEPWTCAVYVWQRRPSRALDRPAIVRHVPHIPWLEPVSLRDLRPE